MKDHFQKNVSCSYEEYKQEWNLLEKFFINASINEIDECPSKVKNSILIHF